jgi:hypothetical protein
VCSGIIAKAPWAKQEIEFNKFQGREISRAIWALGSVGSVEYSGHDSFLSVIKGPYALACTYSECAVHYKDT